MQKSTMAAVLGLADDIVEDTCKEIDGIVVAANYNCPGQLVISGSIEAIDKACALLTEKGARRAIVLPVGGAFHSPLMEPAREQLAAAIENTNFNLLNHANVFARDHLDIGTRFFLEHLPTFSDDASIIDLGCGNGVIGLFVASENNDCEIFQANVVRFVSCLPINKAVRRQCIIWH